MVKKTVAIWAIVMFLGSSFGTYITQRQPLEIPTVNGENDVNQEVVAEKVVLQSTISSYDPIFKEVCREHGNDWRFMSAMAYHESRFTPDITSRQGAQGMMQIMPNVAKFFNVEKEDLTNVETNIMVANLLVNRIDKMLKLPSSTPERDRMGMILASYNGGIGYVLNARTLARRNGEDANSWDVVAKYLALMKDSQFATSNNVRHFRGVGQTLAYVDNVIGHYNHYCQIAIL
ncbi:MAG: transglycosylase SLT domain-containing protein [Rikenellaceae bacterium]